MSYLLSHCEIWHDDQGVGAAEAQLLGVGTHFSGIINEVELCPDTNKGNSSQNETLLMYHCM